MEILRQDQGLRESGNQHESGVKVAFPGFDARIADETDEKSEMKVEMN